MQKVYIETIDLTMRAIVYLFISLIDFSQEIEKKGNAYCTNLKAIFTKTFPDVLN